MKPINGQYRSQNYNNAWNTNEAYLRNYIRSRVIQSNDTSKILFNTYVEFLSNPVLANNQETSRYELKRRAQKEILRFYCGDEGVDIIEELVKEVPKHLAA